MATAESREKVQMMGTDGTAPVDIAVCGSGEVVMCSGVFVTANVIGLSLSGLDIQVNISGDPVVISSGVIDTNSVSVYALYKSPDDFTATYTSSTTITLSALPFSITDSSQIVYVKIVPSSGTASVYTNGYNGVTLTVSSDVVTIAGAGTPFAAGDVYEVGINAQDKAYDAGLDVEKTIDQAPNWSRYTDPEDLIASAQTLTTSFADMGAEIDMRGYNNLGLWLTVDINQANDVEIRLLHKHESAGAEEYREIYLGTPGSNITTINLNDYQVGADSDQLFKINIPVSATTPYIQIQVREKTDGGTDADIDAAVITKSWGA